MKILFASLSRCAFSTAPFIFGLALFTAVLGSADAQETLSTGPRINVAEDGKELTDGVSAPQGAKVKSNRQVRLMVELQEPASAQVYAEARSKHAMTHEQAQAASEKHAAHLESVQRGLAAHLSEPSMGAKQLFRLQRAYNGIAIVVEPGKIKQILAMPGVKAIHPLVPKQRTAASAVKFLGTTSFWDSLHQGGLNIHGEGIKIAIIDTGTDYLHTDFAGPGGGYDRNDTTIIGEPGIPYPGARVKGGYDFAGDEYNADPNSQSYNPIPKPDPDPMDCNGHGTGTAGLAAGSGVNADGSTYVGPYDSTTPFSSLKISPGMAPKADIYALRVFGCAGSTDLVIQAIDWALDPAHRMDVISMSLGSDYGPGDEPDAVAASNAAAAGVITVVAAGNGGDIYYITGSPASGTRAVSVAASFDDAFKYNAVRVNAPSTITGSLLALPAEFSNAPSGQTADVVYALPHNGSTPLTNAAAVAGKIVLIDRGLVTFVSKAKNAQAAGAIGVILADNRPEEIFSPSGSDPSITIPSLFISQQDGNTIKSKLNSNGVGGVNVTLTPDGASGTDQIASYSSRGPRSSDSFLKPDVTAPAEVVTTALVNTGNDVSGFNGTSSATPHVAGAMALMRQLHPGWTVEELKALVMNTADFDLYKLPAKAGSRIGPGRVGNGRMDLAPASQATTVAYSADVPGAVSVSYGVVDVVKEATLTKTITVANKGNAPAKFKVDFTSTGTEVPGVTFEVAPHDLKVPGNSTASVQVTLKAHADKMTHSHDPTVAETQAGFPRQWLTEATGYVTFTPKEGKKKEESATAMRVAVHSAPRPASVMAATVQSVSLPAASGTFTIGLAGTDLRAKKPLVAPFGITSLAKSFELQYISPNEASTSGFANGADLKHVGITSDFSARGGDLASSVLEFGMAFQADHVSPGDELIETDIYIDSNNDGKFDYVLFNGFVSGTNVYMPMLFDLNTGDLSPTGYFTNGYSSSTADTASFNNSDLMLPISAAQLGLTAGHSRITYDIVTYYQGAQADDTGALTYDLAAPGLDTAGGKQEPFLYADTDGNSIPVTYNKANVAANHSLGLMLAHFHNASTGLRSEALTIK